MKECTSSAPQDGQHLAHLFQLVPFTQIILCRWALSRANPRKTGIFKDEWGKTNEDNQDEKSTKASNKANQRVTLSHGKTSSMAPQQEGTICKVTKQTIVTLEPQPLLQVTVCKNKITGETERWERGRIVLHVLYAVEMGGKEPSLHCPREGPPAPCGPRPCLHRRCCKLLQWRDLVITHYRTPCNILHSLL